MSERILSAAARGTYPVDVSEMNLFAATTEDVLATYFAGIRVAERRQAVGNVGQVAALCGTPGAAVRTPPPS